MSSSDNDAESSDPAAVVNMAPDHNYDNPCRSTTCSEQVDQLKGMNELLNVSLAANGMIANSCIFSKSMHMTNSNICLAYLKALV